MWSGSKAAAEGESRLHPSLIISSIRWALHGTACRVGPEMILCRE